MKLLMIGINHEILNLDERKDFYFRESDKYEFSTLLLDALIDQTVILSTCNRSEVYVFVEDHFDEERLKQLFLNFFGKPDTTLLYFKKNRQAMLYLLEVACGLRSMVIGEDQILHQIKESYQWALQQHFTGKEMNYLFHQVLTFAKKMKNTYAISNHPLSLSYIGYQYIVNKINDEDKVMICGSGEMAILMMEYLQNHEMYIVNRTVCATGSPHVIFQDDKVDKVHNLIFLDLAMPRDVDRQLARRFSVIDMDVLQQASSKQLEKRKKIADLIEIECQNFVDEIDDGLQMMKSDNLIQRMQERYLHLSDETYQLLEHKLQLSAKEQYILKKILKTSFLRLLKDPVRLLKEGDKQQQDQYIELLEKMISGEK